MDLSTTNLVIEKLNKSIKGQSIRQSKDIQLRLADLYSERARLKKMSENEQSCGNCMNSKADRLKALNLYYKLFDRFSSETQERLVMQVSHLSISTNQERKATSLYNKVLKSRKYHKNVKARVLLSKAEQQFHKGFYKDSLKNYDKAISKNKKLKSPLVLYRVA